MKPGDIVSTRYVLKREIAAGAFAVTWRAEDRKTGSAVVVKLLSVRALPDWKGLELFQRETAVLKSLRHAGIPAYVDSFTTGKGAKTQLVLVQELVDGMSLQDKVNAGWRGTEEEIRALAGQLLETVRYIHSLRPPIIHRDINPRNVIMREDDAVFLVDFGGVQDALRVSASEGQTVVGTPGYMPMEQFVGRATVRSDLYACATTILYLLTHKDPQDLPMVDMKIDISHLDISPGLAAVLDSWLEPDETKRLLPVETAIRYLQGEAPERPAAVDGQVDLTPPRFSRIRAEKLGDVVTIVIPERGAAGAASAMGGFSVFWLAFVAFWTFLTARLGAWGMSLFSIPFWLAGFYLVRRSLGSFFGMTVLRFDPARGFSYARRFRRGKNLLVPAAEVGRLALAETGSVNGKQMTGLRFEVGARRFTFGQGLSDEEKRWLQGNVNALLESMAKREGAPRAAAGRAALSP